MSTVTRYPSSFSGDYSNMSNVGADDGSNATATRGSNQNATLDAYDWGFNIPSDATINSVTVTYEHAMDVPGYCEYWISTRKNQVIVGTENYEMRTGGFGITLVNKTSNGTWTANELNTDGLGGLMVRFYSWGYYFGAGYTHYIDYVSVTVDYTAPVPKGSFAQII